VANKSLWMALNAEIARHRAVEFSWVKAHIGITLNEIADARTTRGVNGMSYCPTDRFNEIQVDTEPEDGPKLPGVAPVITQTEEWATRSTCQPLVFGESVTDSQKKRRSTVRHQCSTASHVKFMGTQVRRSPRTTLIRISRCMVRTR
jgi:hypothetical protein